MNGGKFKEKGKTRRLQNIREERKQCRSRSSGPLQPQEKLKSDLGENSKGKREGAPPRRGGMEELRVINVKSSNRRILSSAGE